MIHPTQGGRVLPFALVALLLMGAVATYLIFSGDTGPDLGSGESVSHESAIQKGGVVEFPDPQDIAVKSREIILAEELESSGEDDANGDEQISGTGVSGLLLGMNGRPIPGAQVRVLADMIEDDMWGDSDPNYANHEFVAECESDSEGRYVLSELSANATYSLEATTRSGLIGGSQIFQTLSDSILPLPDILLIPGCRISGQVVAQAGQSVEGATVTMTRKKFRWSVQSDKSGSFRSNLLPPGTFVVGVQKLKGQSLPYSVEVRLASGDQEDSLRLALVLSFILRGRTVDEGGIPIPGVKVSAHLNSDSDVERERHRPDSVHSDVDGFFQFDDLLSRRYNLTVFAPGYQKDYVLDVFPGGSPREITLKSAQVVTGIVINSETGAKLGKVDGLKTVTMEYREEDDSGSGSFESIWWGLECDLSDDGSFSLQMDDGELESLAEYRVVAEVRDRPVSYSDALSIPKGQSARDVVVPVYVGRSLVIQVVSAIDGNPVVGARVRLVEGEQENEDEYSFHSGIWRQEVGAGRVMSDRATDDHGAVECVGLTAGAFRVVVEADGYAVHRSTAPSERGTPNEAVHTVELNIGGSLRGLITDGTGAPQSGMVVATLGIFPELDDKWLHPMKKTHSLEAGHYQFEHLPPGKYVVAVFHPQDDSSLRDWRHMTAREEQVGTAFPLIVDHGSSGIVDLTVGGYARGSVRVQVLRSGMPYSSVEVSLLPVEGGNVRDSGLRARVRNTAGNAETSIDGTFRLPSVKPGQYQVVVSPDYRWHLVGEMFQVVEGEETEVQAHFQLTDLQCHIVDSEGNPIQHASLQLAGEANESGRSPSCYSEWNDEGYYRIDAIPPGSYDARIRAVGFHSTTRRLDISALTRTTTMEYVVQRGGWMKVIVRGDAPRRLYFKLRFENSGRSTSARRDEEGCYRVEIGDLEGKGTLSVFRKTVGKENNPAVAEKEVEWEKGEIPVVEIDL